MQFQLVGRSSIRFKIWIFN